MSRGAWAACLTLAVTDDRRRSTDARRWVAVQGSRESVSAGESAVWMSWDAGGGAVFREDASYFGRLADNLGENKGSGQIPKSQFEPSTTHQIRQYTCHDRFSGNVNGQQGDDICLEEQGKARQTDAYVC